MKKHFVQFLSPGTFFSETTEKEIDSWDVEQAKEMAHYITERHNATPFGFRFLTRERGPDDLDSKVTTVSGIYYLGGHLETLEQVQARNDPNDETLIWNMKMNDIERVVVNQNSYRSVFPFEKDDVLLDWSKR